MARPKTRDEGQGGQRSGIVIPDPSRALTLVCTIDVLEGDPGAEVLINSRQVGLFSPMASKAANRFAEQVLELPALSLPVKPVTTYEFHTLAPSTRLIAYRLLGPAAEVLFLDSFDDFPP